MIEELENMRLLDVLRKSDASRVIYSVCKKLKETFKAHIVDIMWKKESKDGVILQPFVNLNTSSRLHAQPYEIPRRHEVSTAIREGIWTWVYRNSEPVWLESIKAHDLQNNSAQNLATNGTISPEYLYVFEETDSLMAIPLNCTGIGTWGVLCIELPRSGVLSRQLLKLLQRLSGPIADIIFKSDTLESNHEQATTAINRFDDLINQVNLRQILEPVHVGFIARPFQNGFENVENVISSFLKENEIKCQSYRQDGSSYIFSDIIEQIKVSHFGIADITGNNPNVMIELGMMRVLEKKILLLKRKDDTTNSIPFNIRPFSYFQYDQQGQDDFRIWDPAKNRFHGSIKEAMSPFIEDFIIS